MQVSFGAPIDFATGANPSSAAFNAASGDQLALTVAHAALSDSVAVGDFNRDGRPDVGQTNVIAGSLSIFLGDGRAGFAPPVIYSVGAHPTFVVAGDLDLDGRLDLAVANTGSDSLATLSGNGDGTFQAAEFVSVPDPRNIAIGRFNRDVVPDLAVASGAPAGGSASPAGGVVVLTGNGDGTFGQTQVISHRHTVDGLPVSANYVAVGDFDGSGFDDLAVGVGTTRNAGDRKAGDPKPVGDDLLIYLNRNQTADALSAQPFNAAPDHPAIRVGGTPDAIAVTDLNADAHADLAVMSNGSGDITSLLGDGRGRFGVKAINVTVGAVPRAVAVADFDADGNPDLVAASFGASTVSLLRGNGDGTLQPAVDFWAGDAPTGVAVGDFNGDGRPDVVAARLRTDQLSLLLNGSPQRGDGVAVQRDIPYGSPTDLTNDLLAAHHTLDVYTPPNGTASFAGRGRPYPVVFFIHGGAGVSGDKSTATFLLRSLAVEGIVAVSTNYRLGPGLAKEQAADVAQAFRWTRDNVGSNEYGGDPKSMFVFAHSAGAAPGSKLGTDDTWKVERQSIRGMVLVSAGEQGAPTPTQPPSLLVNGTEGLDIGLMPASAAFSEASRRRGAESTHLIVADRDHFTILSDMARRGDPAREAMLSFMRAHS